MSNKLKRRRQKVFKKDCGERYRFLNGVAVVPGVTFQGKPMLITLEEFNELAKNE